MRLIGSAILVCFSLTLFAQKYYTKNGAISFYSETPIENIEAHNKRVTAVLDAESGRIEFAALIKAFQFEKALMQEHFNENYLESDTYPKAVFRGAIADASKIDFETPGTYEVTVSGALTLHGVSNDIAVPATFIVGEALTGHSTFMVACADYDIKIPKVVAGQIAESIRVDVSVNLQPL